MRASRNARYKLFTLEPEALFYYQGQQRAALHLYNDEQLAADDATRRCPRIRANKSSNLIRNELKSPPSLLRCPSYALFNLGAPPTVYTDDE